MHNAFTSTIRMRKKGVFSDFDLDVNVGARWIREVIENEENTTLITTITNTTILLW